MKSAMTEAERQKNRSLAADYGEQREANKRRLEAIAAERKAPARDALVGDAEAEATIERVDREADEIARRNVTLTDAISDLDAEWEDDAPARQAEAKARRQAAALVDAEALLADSAEADMHLQKAAEALIRRDSKVAALNQYSDLGLPAMHRLDAIIFPALGAAGMAKLDHRFAVRPEETNSIVDRDAEQLRVLLPHDHAALAGYRAVTRARDEAAARDRDRARNGSWEDKPSLSLPVASQKDQHAAAVAARPLHDPIESLPADELLARNGGHL